MQITPPKNWMDWSRLLAAIVSTIPMRIDASILRSGILLSLMSDLLWNYPPLATTTPHLPKPKKKRERHLLQRPITLIACVQTKL